MPGRLPLIMNGTGPLELMVRNWIGASFQMICPGRPGFLCQRWRARQQ